MLLRKQDEGQSGMMVMMNTRRAIAASQQSELNHSQLAIIYGVGRTLNGNENRRRPSGTLSGLDSEALQGDVALVTW